MAAICNGMAYDGLFRASGATFLVFADYCRPSIRLAALAKLPVTYIFTHDSVGVGEDGPTHQPVETVSALRLIPNLDVIRPADAEETAASFVAALERTDGPTLLALSRQDLPHLGFASAKARRDGVFRGGYILKKESAALTAIVLATGSEVQHAVAAAKDQPGVRIVSLPCFERFDRQPQAYRDEVLPPVVHQTHRHRGRASPGCGGNTSAPRARSSASTASAFPPRATPSSRSSASHPRRWRRRSRRLEETHRQTAAECERESGELQRGERLAEQNPGEHEGADRPDHADHAGGGGAGPLNPPAQEIRRHHRADNREQQAEVPGRPG